MYMCRGGLTCMLVTQRCWKTTSYLERNRQVVSSRTKIQEIQDRVFFLNSLNLSPQVEILLPWHIQSGEQLIIVLSLHIQLVNDLTDLTTCLHRTVSSSPSCKNQAENSIIHTLLSFNSLCPWARYLAFSVYHWSCVEAKNKKTLALMMVTSTEAWSWSTAFRSSATIGC